MNQPINLFGPKTIRTIGFNESEMIRDILNLHCDGKQIECDLTYSKGIFYKNGIQEPKYKLDLIPQSPGVISANSIELPLKSNSIETIIFDPPFVIGGKNHKENKKGSSVIAKRFGRFTSWKELEKMYRLSLSEIYRVLKNNGILIFKNQDVVASGVNYFTHVWLMIWALEIGFTPIDLFILLSEYRLTDQRIQQHARKYHCYFWVFKKYNQRREIW